MADKKTESKDKKKAEPKKKPLHERLVSWVMWGAFVIAFAIIALLAFPSIFTWWPYLGNLVTSQSGSFFPELKLGDIILWFLSLAFLIIIFIAPIALVLSAGRGSYLVARKMKF